MGNHKSQRVIQLEQQLEEEHESYKNQIVALIAEISTWQQSYHELEDKIAEVKQKNLVLWTENYMLQEELATWKHPTAYHMTSPIHGSIDTSGLERHEG